MEEMVFYNWVLVTTFPLYLLYRWTRSALDNIPTVGPSAPVLSYYGAYKFFNHATEMIQEGYNRYKDSVFKVAMMNQWLVVVSGPQLIEELRKLPDDQASFLEGSGEIVQTKWALGHDVHDDPYHVDVIRSHLTRQLGVLFADVKDEIDAAYQEYIPATSNQWVEVHCMDVMRKIVARASNRIFVGKSKCRDLEYLQLAIDFTLDVSKVRKFLSFSPVAWLKPLTAYFITDVEKSISRGTEHLQDMIEERQEQLAIHGDNWAEKPNDMLMWLMDEAKSKPERSLRSIVQRLLVINFAAIHTSSNSVTHAVYHLAANPEFLKPLREEVDAIIQLEGWNKAAVAKMRKVDSFLKESQRVNGINCISVMRKTLQDVTFSDETFIPAGTLVVAAASATHYDEKNYPNPEVFSPFRFSEMRQEEGESIKHQYVSTSVDYVSFGHGKHACPGRFFAANELKTMLAYIVLNYDVKFADEGVRPPNRSVGLSIIPDPFAKVLFRKRAL